MGTLNLTEVLDFTGGMSTVKAMHLIDKTEAVISTNVDIKNGSLRSVPRPNHLRGVAGSYFVEFKGEVYEYANWRSNAILDNKLYWSNGSETGKIMENGDELAIGLPTPIGSLGLAPTGVGSGAHVGDFKYTYTFYSSETGVESAPASLPLYLTVDQDNIVVTGFQALPLHANMYRLYRIGGYLPRFQMVAQIDPDEEDLPYIDSLDDTEIDGRIMQTLRAGTPPVGIQFFTELGGRMYGALGSHLYYSAVGNADSWYVADFFILQDAITGIAKAQGGLLIFGRTFTYMLQGSAPQNFRLRVVSDVLGCVSASSISYIGGRAIWLGESGIYTSDSYSIHNLSADKIERMFGLEASSSVTLNDVYYLSFRPSLYPHYELYPDPNQFPSAVQGTGGVESGVIAIDFKRGKGFSYGLRNIRNVASIGIIGSELHVVTSVPAITFLDCDSSLGCFSTLQCTNHDISIVDIMTGQGYLPLAYLSPQFIDGTFSTLKEYDKVRVNFRGDFVLTVIFANGDVAVTEILRSKLVDASLQGGLEFSEDNLVIVGIPNGANRSESIQFLVVGVGTIKSIQYSYKMRELP